MLIIKEFSIVFMRLCAFYSQEKNKVEVILHHPTLIIVIINEFTDVLVSLSPSVSQQLASIHLNVTLLNRKQQHSTKLHNTKTLNVK